MRGAAACTQARIQKIAKVFKKKLDNFKLFLETIIFIILLYIFHNCIHTTSLKLSIILQHKDGNKTEYVWLFECNLLWLSSNSGGLNKSQGKETFNVKINILTA